jgi:HTH-type transcriptional repressor of NAD biosynthesis genes
MIMNNGLILMTALPPTIGHRLLIDFANNFLNTKDFYKLHVLINGRKHEPIKLIDRYDSLEEEFRTYENIRFHFYEGDIPQEPEDHPDFWSIWKKLIKVTIGETRFDYVFASDTYGIELANQLNAKFIPCNIYREVIDVSATKIRNDPLENFNLLLPAFQKNVKQTITIFGPESVGKTTLSKALANNVNGYYVPEWAREYLEQVAGSEVTDEKMKMISYGQAALEISVDNLYNKPFIIRDTDLLSTYGYYLLWKGKGNFDDSFFRGRKYADFYIVQNDQITFTPDSLRYGGDKRESDNKFWINILKDLNFPYYEIQSLGKENQLKEAEKVVKNIFYNKNNWRFIR